MNLHDQVIAALDAEPEDNGVIVCKQDGTLLAYRDPAPEGGCTLVCLDAEPFGFPDPEPKGARVGTWHVIEGGPAHRAASRRQAEG
jgi:hypothetical protein